MEIALLLNKTAGFSLRAKIETRLNAKSWQRGPGLVAIVINNPLGEDQGCKAGRHQALEIHGARLSSDRVFTIQPGGLTPVNHSPDPAPSMGARALANLSLVG